MICADIMPTVPPEISAKVRILLFTEGSKLYPYK